MMKRYLMVAALAAVLAGCGSNVKLDPPIQGSGADARAQVRFLRHGVKWLALGIAKLTVVE